jgi:hypothetical protein
MPAYMKIDPQLRAAFVAEQTARLRDGFDAFDPEVDLIHVRVPGWLRLPNHATRDAAFRQGAPVTLRLEIDNFNDKTLPFQVGGNWIAVLPEDIDAALNFSLSEAEFRDLARHAHFPDDAQTRRAAIDLLILPYAADTRTPATMKGLKLWKLRAHVAQVGLWSGEEFLWPVYNAPWYRSETRKELMRLYR